MFQKRSGKKVKIHWQFTYTLYVSFFPNIATTKNTNINHHSDNSNVNNHHYNDNKIIMMMIILTSMIVQCTPTVYTHLHQCKKDNEKNVCLRRPLMLLWKSWGKMPLGANWWNMQRRNCLATPATFPGINMLQIRKYLKNIAGEENGPHTLTHQLLNSSISTRNMCACHRDGF